MNNVKKLLLYIFIFLFMIPSFSFAAKPKIVVLANSIDLDLASDFFGFLGNRGLEVVHATSENFEEHKDEKFIVVLGGPDAPEGVGDIVKSSGILSIDDVDNIRKEGSIKKFVASNPWNKRPGQVVWIIAGSNREETMLAHADHRASVSQDIAYNLEQEKIEALGPCPENPNNPITHYAQFVKEENRGDVYICEVIYNIDPINWKITLYNQANQDINLANYWLTDRASKFYYIAKSDTAHPPRVEIIRANGYWSVNASIFNPEAISGPYTSSGLYLHKTTGTLQLNRWDDRILDAVSWSQGAPRK
jgi:hypothetical protein